MKSMGKNFKFIFYNLFITAFVVSTGFAAPEKNSTPTNDQQVTPVPSAPAAPSPQEAQPAQQAKPEEPAGKKLTIVNGTSWEATLSYTTPLDVKTNTTVQPNSSGTIVSKDGIVNYALRKEKQKTPDRLTSTGEGEFRIDEDMLNSLLEKLHQNSFTKVIEEKKS